MEVEGHKTRLLKSLEKAWKRYYGSKKVSRPIVNGQKSQVQILTKVDLKIHQRVEKI